MKKDSWKEYFSFSKKERIGIFILLAVTALFIVLPWFFSPEFKKPFVDETLQQQLLAAETPLTGDVSADSITEVRMPQNSSPKNEINLFYFDPNILNAEGWKQLGLPDKTIQTILNYRDKGGHFYRPDDLRKIYGLTEDQADLLIPYIQINNQKNKSSPAKSNERKNAEPAPGIKKIDINTATADEFKMLPGIGDVLSKRIVKFRNSIRGFKSIEDIKRTYGLSDSTYQLILPYLTISDSASAEN